MSRPKKPLRAESPFFFAIGLIVERRGNMWRTFVVDSAHVLATKTDAT